jgi:hypothetical protein
MTTTTQTNIAATSSSVAKSLDSLKPYKEPISVILSNALVHLLSDQLYQSPVKAVEELVVNAYDAEAHTCCVYVPYPSNTQSDFIIVFDDGIGMSYEGLIELWKIGDSNKREPDIETLRKRKQIGKFGIGKLAAQTIGNKLTYITKNQGQILSVTVNFNDFKKDPTLTNTPKLKNDENQHNEESLSDYKRVPAQIHVIDNLAEFLTASPLNDMLIETFDDEALKTLLGSTKTPDKTSKNINEVLSGKDSWTIALIEGLTEKGKSIKNHTLSWVLSTAMPLVADFKLFLNGKEIKSSKEKYETLVEFDISELPKKRLEDLKKVTGEEWKKEGNSLVSKSFKLGVRGTTLVTKQSLYGGKSDDLERSHGFFIRVLHRLLDYKDPLFGLKPLTYEIFNRLHVEIDADDLDIGLTASRETVEESAQVQVFRDLLRAIFNEALQRYKEAVEKKESKENPKKEGERDEVSHRLVEYPIADALLSQSDSFTGADADENWFYLSLPDEKDIDSLINDLYTSNRQKYKYHYTSSGRTGRLVKFDPKTSTFDLNSDHEFVKEYLQDNEKVLQDFVTAEALLEVYLRQHQVPINIVAEVLEQRDKLLRSLAKDQCYSFKLIAQRLRDSAADEHELEISLVVAARALGFNATHISGSGNPDGIAKFFDYPNGEKTIILEAKSSVDTPSLGAIDFGGLHEHKITEEVEGCLLVAPSYPGETREVSAVNNRGNNLKISCWTIELLASVVEVAESRHINANHILEIVLNKFAPKDVEKAVKDLLAEPQWNQTELYVAIVETLEKLQKLNTRENRSVGMLYGHIGLMPNFENIERQKVENAVKDLESASKGGLKLLSGGNIAVRVALDELKRRLSNLLNQSGFSRRKSSFRQDEKQ